MSIHCFFVVYLFSSQDINKKMFLNKSKTENYQLNFYDIQLMDICLFIKKKNENENLMVARCNFIQAS